MYENLFNLINCNKMHILKKFRLPEPGTIVRRERLQNIYSRYGSQLNHVHAADSDNLSKNPVFPRHNSTDLLQEGIP